MLATITHHEINDPNYATPIMYKVTLHAPLLQERPISCYSLKAIAMLVSKYSIEHVHYALPHDGALVNQLTISGATISSR